MTTPQSITINSDMGESFGLHSFGNDEAITPSINLANVACGGHAGDPEVMRTTVEALVAHGVAVGAHPGLPDLVGFGRRAMALLPDEVESLLLHQVGSLVAFLRREGATLSHIKPHGALYGMLARDPELMAAAARVLELYEVPMLGLAGTAHEQVCRERGLPIVLEMYVDLDYADDGSLIITRRPSPTDPQRAADRVRRALAEGVIASAGGVDLPVRFESICVHSDAPGSPEVAAAVRAALDDAPGA